MAAEVHRSSLLEPRRHVNRPATSLTWKDGRHARRFSSEDAMPFRPLDAGTAVISRRYDRLELEGNRSGASAPIGAVELSLLSSCSGHNSFP